LAEDYRPSDSEQFMCVEQRAYFLQKLKGGKKSSSKSREPWRSSGPLLQNRHCRSSIERDHYRSSCAATDAQADRQIDTAIRRLYDGEYGYCEVTRADLTGPPQPSDRDDSAWENMSD
jgi:DnaK suppressor protein